MRSYAPIVVIFAGLALFRPESTTNGIFKLSSEIVFLIHFVFSLFGVFLLGEQGP